METRSKKLLIFANKLYDRIKISIIKHFKIHNRSTKNSKRFKRFRSIYPLTTINSLPFFGTKTKLQRSSKNSNHGGGGSSDLHSPLSFCIRSASNANSIACDTFSPRRLAMQYDINNKKGDNIFNKIHGKSIVYRLSSIRKENREK